MTLETEDRTRIQEAQAPAPEPDVPPEEPDEDVSFIDRVIAFAVLVVPFTFLTVWVQSLLKDRVSLSIHNMVMLAGIVGFLLVVGKASRWLSSYRRRMQK
jgi:hypothetical protein